MSNLPEGFSIIKDEVSSLPPGFSIASPESSPTEAITPQEFSPSKQDEFFNPPDIPGEAIAAGRESIKDRSIEAAKTLVDYKNGDIGAGEAAVQLIGKWHLGTMFDLTGEAVKASGRGLALLIPDTIEEPTLRTMKKGWDWLVGTEAGQLGAEALSEGIDKYNEWKGENPQDAKTFESVVNIAAVAVPGPKAKPVTGGIEKAATGLEKAAAKQIAKKKSEFVKDLLTPIQTKKQRMEQVSRTRQTFLGKNVTQPSPREAAARAEVSTIDKINPTRSPQYNYNVIADQNKKLAQTLEARLSAARGVVLPNQKVFKAIDDGVAELVQSNPVIVGNAESTSARVLTKAKELVAANDATPLGVLKARKQFDKYISGLKGDAVFDPAVDNAMTVSVRTVRQAMNKAVNEAVPSAQVEKLLKKQTRLYDAMDIVQPKAAEEAATAVGRLFQNAIRVTRAKAELNRDAAILLGVGAYGAATQISPWILGGAALTAVGAAATKGVLSPEMKKGLGYVLTQTNKAIKMTKQPEMLKQLKADRIVLMDILQSSTVEGEDQQ